MNRIDFNQWTNPTNTERVELIFESRHKAYGAYALRTQYDRTLIRAFVSTVFILLSLFLIPFVKQLFANNLPTIHIQGQNDSIVAHVIEITPMKKKVVKHLKTKSGKKNNQAQLYTFMDTLDQVDTSEVLSSELQVGPIGDSNSIDLPFIDGNSEFGNTIVVQTKKKEEDLNILTVPPIMPQFIGGETALYDFLGNELKIPDEAIDEGVSARVTINFVVEKDGSISNIKILACNQKGYGFENEAIEVVSKMPSWKPGYQNGHPVRVYFNLPINFIVR
jgi:protein TonB